MSRPESPALALAQKAEVVQSSRAWALAVAVVLAFLPLAYSPLVRSVPLDAVVDQDVDRAHLPLVDVDGDLHRASLNHPQHDKDY